MLTHYHLGEYEKDLFPDPSMFLADSPAHGRSHTRNVILLALLICRTMGWKELMKDVWAAACIHDCRRQHDGHDPRHGVRAVEYVMECMPEGRYPVLRHIKSSPNALAILEAVDLHDRFDPRGENRYSFQKWDTLTKILTCLMDADALERVRFGNQECGLNTSFLQTPRAPLLVSRAIFLHRNRHLSDDRLKALFLEELNKHTVPLPSIKVNTKFPGFPDIYDNIDDIRTLFGLPGVTKVLRDTGCLMNLQESDFRRNCAGWSFVTFTRHGKDFENSFTGAPYQGFWDLIDSDPVFHERAHQYADNVKSSRRYNELKTFGYDFRGVYGTLYHPEMTQHRIDSLKSMYGDDMIIWDVDKLDPKAFSWTPGDNMETIVPALPFDRDCTTIVHSAECAYQKGISGSPFVEVHYHGQLTNNELKEVL
jgi:hypothetical protein